MAATSVDNLTRGVYAALVYRPIVLMRGEGSVFRCLRELRALERCTPEELRARQRKRLGSILSYARERVPLYEERWRGLTALEELPFLTKDDLQLERARLEARGRPRRVTEKTTGGSTGQAVTLLKDRSATAAEMAATWLGYGWFGIQPGDRAAKFWGAPTTARRRLRAIGAAVAMRRASFSAFAFTDDDLERYWRTCRRFRPAYLYGYVSMLEAFARYVRGRGYDPQALGVKLVVTTSEVLSGPQRDTIQQAFGVPVQNEYGCGEVGPIAYSCERGQLHVMSENLFVEVITPAGSAARPGESGELVITDLNNRAMPLVRYRVGDLAVRGDDRCPCGRGFPTLMKVWGRAYDFISTPEGRRYHGEFFMYVFEDLRTDGHSVRQFQVLQTSESALRVRLAAEPSEELRGVVRAAFAERLPTMEVEIEFVSTIERTNSGKLRLIENTWLRAAEPSAYTSSDA